MRKPIVFAAALLAVSMGVGGVLPAAAQTKERVNLRLSWIASGEYAMYPYAVKKGGFDAEGIDLQVLEGNGSVSVIQSIGAGTDRFADVDMPTAVGLITKGVPVRIIASLSNRTPASIIFFADKGIKTPKDLEGKKVGMTAGDSNHILFQLLVKANNVDKSKVQEVLFDPRSRNTALLLGQVDAIGGYWTNDAPRLEDTAKKKVSALRYADFGVNMMSRALILNVRNLGERSLNCRMVRATLKAWADAAANSQEAAQALVEAYPKAGAVALNRTQWENNATLMGKGPVAREDFDHLLSVQKAYGGLGEPKPHADYYTNAFIGC
jgi:NitT/TauT family transport system substrate-binding protein